MIEKNGKGWRIAIDRKRSKFPVLIGGQYWAVELTDKEWEKLVGIVLALTSQHEDYKDKLLEEEEITYEMEKSNLWGCLEGYKDFWSMRIIISGDDISDRGVEMYWPNFSAQEFVAAMRIMWDSNQ